MGAYEWTSGTDPDQATMTWSGGTSTDWNVDNNWVGGLTPYTTDNAIIPAGVSHFPVITAAITCNNLTINSSAVVTVNAGGQFSVNGTLTNSAGNSGLVIKSTSEGTGSLIHSTASVPGTIERYIPAATWGDWKDGWHSLSSPVASQAIYSAFVSTYSLINEDFFKWNEAINSWISFKNSSGTGQNPDFSETEFIVGKGYLVAYASTVTKNFTGILNVADVSVSGLEISTGTNKGWHLLGNPFASAITWYTDWPMSNIGGTANIWNEAGQSYTPIVANGVIPAGNGFIVQASGGTGMLTIPAAKRSHNAQAWYKDSDYPVIKLFAHNLDFPSFQESQVRFNPEATVGFDPEHDGHFLTGYAPLFYSVMNGEKLMVNSLPEFSEETAIPFSFVKNEGTNFTIEATGIETLEPAATVFMKDNKLGINHNLSENPVYVFTSADGDAPARFELHFGSVGINETPITQTIQAWYYAGILNVKASEGLTAIGIFNIQGQNLQNYQLFGSGLQTLQLNLPAGVYFARILNKGNLQTVKMIVQ